jgi:two-component system sensor histidine kinase PilS (NtrC family)
MVSDNVERLKRIIDDVLEAAPGGPPHAAPVIDVCAVVASTCSEWMQAEALPPGPASPVQADLSREALGAAFDADHLRRVLVNLLDNALRHASGAPGSVHLSLQRQAPAAPSSATSQAKPPVQSVLLSISSDGAPIAPTVEPYLFEPFFSTRSRGTGLGLYICRELCERYGASIDYRLQRRGPLNRNEFFVVIPLQALDAPEASLPLPT